MRAGLLLLVLGLGAGHAALADGADSARTPLEAGREALRGGIAFLLDTQNQDGSWGYHAQRKPHRIFAPTPGAYRSFGAATSALGLMAVLAAPDGNERLPESRRRAMEYVLAHARVKRSQGNEIYGVWSYGYGLQALARCLKHEPFRSDRPRIREKMTELIDALRLYQAVDGGWGYFDFRAKTFHPSGDTMSFTTAMILIALHEARQAGLTVSPVMVTKAVRCLRRCRTKEGSYIYSFWWRYRPLGPINRPAGSLTRTPGCDLALRLFGEDIGVDDLTRGVERLLEHRKYARMGLHRPIPHESWFGVSGYFYLYGYYYAGECYPLLPAEARARLRDGLIGEILVTRSKDGSFWDYPLYGYSKPYGTAYAVLGLLPLCR